MPQTLLSLAALVAAAFFTLGQKQASTHTMESIVRDEFEVAVSGSLLQTTEYADSRAFDEATTPARLRARLRLPATLTQQTLDTLTLSDVTIPTSDFTAPDAFGRDPAGNRAVCDSQNQLASVGCNDVSDFHDRTGITWRDVTLETPGGDPLPVEVRVEVHYVEASQPDVIVNYRTNHKRVDVWARSPVLSRRYPNTDYTVRMNRVISFDPAVAMEYLKRSTCVVGASNAAQLSRLQAAVTSAQTAADAARARVTTTAAAVVTAQATAAQRATEATAAAAAIAPAQAAVTQATTQLTQANQTAQTAQAAQTAAVARRTDAQATLTAAQAEVARVQAQIRTTTGLTQLYLVYVTLPAAQGNADRAQTAYNDAAADAQAATTAATAATAAATTAQQTLTNAQQNLTRAQQTSATAQQTLATAQAAVVTAQAAAASAVTAAAEADRVLAAAQAALTAFNGGCQS